MFSYHLVYFRLKNVQINLIKVSDINHSIFTVNIDFKNNCQELSEALASRDELTQRVFFCGITYHIRKLNLSVYTYFRVGTTRINACRHRVRRKNNLLDYETK